MKHRTTKPCTTLPSGWPRNDDQPLIGDVAHDARTDETVATISDSTVEHSLVVVELVSDREDCCATELSPLYEVIDPENLDRIFDDPLADSDIVLSFVYEGYNVTVSADAVAISPIQ